MNRIIAAALVASAAFAGTAQAMVNTIDAVRHEVQTYAPGADLDGLSSAQVAALQSIIHGGDTESEKRTKIRNIVN
ncbi:hypothetical protein [Pseudoponticoccus marisrubri]|uniref:Uncharacterized protein n=1 Tax=Pseudoponticoccus marisrubri TaxID=1685382 RepID=A0A0W7WG95_9RHOB|nr:hypothetical protein [Pseudoponticoccus marisrubri]KUF09496.1 hypothetical protein AVJ23_17810 [Pseudoponticoccus marisrubri]